MRYATRSPTRYEQKKSSCLAGFKQVPGKIEIMEFGPMKAAGNQTLSPLFASPTFLTSRHNGQ